MGDTRTKWVAAVLPVIVLAVATGCAGIGRQGVTDAGLDVPIRVGLGAEALTRDQLRLRSGQLIEAPHCCPPLELRDASGTVVQRLRAGSTQRVEVPPGRYLLVGHDPAGGEHSVPIEIIAD